MARLTNYQLRATSYGFTLIEVVVATFILGTVVAGMFGLFLLTARGAQTGERRIVAVALANEKIETVRNLPYRSVGTVGGVPSGAIVPEETISRNGQTYTVRTDIRYVDDPYDGSLDGAVQEEDEEVTVCHKPGTPAEQTLVIGGSALDAHIAHGDTTGPCGAQGEGTESGDENNADYKQVRVAVSWPSRYDLSPVLLITYVAPQGIEGGELGGTLDFHAFDATGEAVAGATVVIVNDDVDPPITITTQTNAEGRVVLPGLPAATDSYEIAVSKAGFTEEQTYDASSNFFPLAEYAHFSMLVKQVTQKTFFIDQVATLTVHTVDEEATMIPNIAYTVRGTKTIALTGAGAPIYKVDEAAQTSATGERVHGGLPWDTYEFSLSGTAPEYDIKETSTVLPLVISPGQDLDLTVTLVPHTPHSLQAAVVDSSGMPIDNATVRVTGSGFDVTHVTGPPGQVFFADVPASGTFEVAVDASGFEPLLQDVEIAGTTRVRLELGEEVL